MFSLRVETGTLRLTSVLLIKFPHHILHTLQREQRINVIVIQHMGASDKTNVCIGLLFAVKWPKGQICEKQSAMCVVAYLYV